MTRSEAVEWFEAHKPPKTNVRAQEAREAALTALKALEFMSEFFDAPCAYTINDIDMHDIINEDGWCEDYCEDIKEDLDYAECWFRAYQLYRGGDCEK